MNLAEFHSLFDLFITHSINWLWSFDEGEGSDARAANTLFDLKVGFNRSRHIGRASIADIKSAVAVKMLLLAYYANVYSP